jgi:hypothetical protein
VGGIKDYLLFYFFFIKLINLLRTVLDRHAFSIQSAQLSRTRVHNERFRIVSRHPRSAPEWAFVRQETPADTDFSGPETPGVPSPINEINEIDDD